jgi:exonuclease III
MAYEFLHNSSKSKRGVGILISAKLGFVVQKTYRDPDNNVLGLVVESNGVKILLISVYGPNNNNMEFFEFLTGILDENRSTPVICGGDWNLTYSTDPTVNNIDIINMASPPSVIRSKRLSDLCADFHLIDPYRALHPSRREYTYVPRARTANRSRIDFFLISDILINLIDDCSISSGLLTTLFDHKNVTLYLNKKKGNINMHRIDPSIFNHPRFPAVVACTAVETYLQHAQPEQVGVDIDAGLEEVGTVINKIREINDLEFEMKFDGSNELMDLEFAGKTASLKESIDNFPDPERLNEILLNCEHDIFLEVLMSNIRNSLISFQAWIKKVEHAKCSYLTKNLNTLKNNYEENFELITDFESQLTNIYEKKLSEKIKQIKLYECLHDEKPSPLFLSLTKCSGKNSLKAIKNEKGECFSSDEDRLEFVRNEFEKLFKKRDCEESVDYSTCIYNFLGNDIVNNPIVQNSLLTDQEAESLDAPLRLEELDESMRTANMRSAPGFDGYSNSLILKCWPYFRIPLLNYFNCCLRKGSLTENFKSACIRLIPKKGDLTKLKNWRPISLLSNMYKILSRAINTRLEKIVNRVCSRAQKGYNNKRFTQEVLINVCDTIGYCRDANLNGALVAIDMAKAFDTLSHKFLNAVLKFFRFGPEMIKMLELLGNNRQACILGENNFSSKYFQLGSGRAQGDNLSPNTFNFGEQILIFKIELDPKIKPIPRNNLNIVNTDAVFMQESNRETSKNESLADDNSTLMIIDEEGLRNLRNHLDRFSLISGLECNYDKTVLMPFLDNLDADFVNILNESGFKIVEKLELLGVVISKNLNSFDENFVRAKQKIVSKISFWDRFNLSLPGRISIAKTFMIPLVNYLGCFLSPGERILSEIQELIDNFVKKNLKISRERMYLPVKFGGIGMFDLSKFLSAQKFTWVVRAFKLPIDNWRYDLHAHSPENNVLLIRESDIDASKFPILIDIVKSFREISTVLEKKNLWESEIFENRNFKFPGTDTMLTRIFFGRLAYSENETAIRTLKLKECFNGNQIKSCFEFQEMGIPLTVAKWLTLSGALSEWKRSVSLADPSFNVRNFIGSIKKGSKKIRNLYEEINYRQFNICGSVAINTFCGLIDCGIPAPNIISCWIGTWAVNFLNNDLKTFIYNNRFNCLPLNNRLNAYRPEIDARCSFCRIVDRMTTEREGYKHIFFSCRSVSVLIDATLDKIALNLGKNSAEFWNLYWFGERGGDSHSKIVWLLFFDVFRYTIYKYKMKKNIPNADFFLRDFCFVLTKLTEVNKKFKSKFLSQQELAWFTRAIG